MAQMNFKFSDELRQAIGRAADKANLPMNEWVAKQLAKALRDPSLGEMKRKRPGRPRK